MSELDIQPALVAELLVDFLREEVGSAGMQRALLGVSGGIDSAVAAALSARAFGPENVLGVLLPYRLSDPRSEAHAKLVIARLALRRGDRVAARSGLADALEIAVALGRPALKLAGVRCFADVLEADGEALCAMQLLAYVADHPATQAIERSDLLARIGKLQGGGRAASPMRLELDALVHRIVVERDLAHRPLIAALRGST